MYTHLTVPLGYLTSTSMKKGMILFLYLLSIIWTLFGLLIVRGAWNENEANYKQITGKLSQPLKLSYEEHDIYPEQRVVMSTIFMEGDNKEYRLRGKLYHLNREGMESIQVGETLHLMVKKTSLVGGLNINNSTKSATVSGIYRSNGEVIIPLEKGIEHSKQRVLIGIGFIVMGFLVGSWAYVKQ